MKSLLILNPTAGQHREADIRQSLQRGFPSRQITIALTQRAGDAKDLAHQAAESGRYEAIYAAGGDGTINEVANGILQAGPQKRPRLGLVPLGTCNVLATELGIPTSGWEDALAILQAGRTRMIDAGRVGDRYFLLMAGFGFDAEAVRGVASPVKSLVGAPAYVMSAVATLAQCQASRVHMQLDDEEVVSDAFMVLIANASSYASAQLKIAPFAAMDDGWLDICLFERPPMDKVGFVGQLLLLLARQHLRDPRVRYYRARRIHLESDPPIAGHLDGDLWGQTPVEIEVVPKALEIIVP